MALLGTSGVLVTGVICVAAMYYMSLVQSDWNASNQFKADVTSLTQSFLESRQLTSDFLRQPSETSSKKYGDNYARQIADLSRVEAFAMGFPDYDPLKKAIALRSVIDLYASCFQKLVSAQRDLGFNEDDGYQGKLRKAVHTAERVLATLSQPRLTLLMLTMRTLEKDFILRAEDRYGEQLARVEAEFEAAVAQANLPPDAQSQILGPIRAYKSTFVSYMETQQSLSDQISELSQIYGQIRPMILEIMAAADARSKTAETRAEEIRWKLIWTIGVATMLVGLIALLFGQRTAKLVAAMTAAMCRLGDGQFDVVLPGLGRNDELGAMAQAVEMFKFKVREKARAELDLKAEHDRITAAHRKADIAKLAGEFEAAVGTVIDSVSTASAGLEASARSLTSTADHGRQLSVEVASSSNEASANVQLVAVATDQMAATIADIGSQVEETADMALEAVRKVELSDRRMVSLSPAAERIGSVVELIAAVAHQINLLALNATIEAARAGDFGRGFAIVAQEVKVLAGQTANATVEIREQIGGIQAATVESVGAVTEIGAIINRISEIAKTVVGSVGEQEVASKSIAVNVQSAAARTTEVAAKAREVTIGANETGGLGPGADVSRTDVSRKLSAEARTRHLSWRDPGSLGRPSGERICVLAPVLIVGSVGPRLSLVPVGASALLLET